jgi:hypothetical protein
MLKSSTMKPNFTLSLSFDGIRLLHRVSDGWRLVGEVMLDSADLAAELAVLRKTATALEPGGLRSLLLIPDAQIKYLTIETPGMDEDGRRAAAATALEGATPYAVTDLVFDVSADGPQSHVAAVARETLEEAEAFAVEHRFHPVAFTATPDEDVYRGAPDFGPTKAASDLLEPSESIEPEKTPVKALPAAPVPDGPIADTTETSAPVADQPSEATPAAELAPTPSAPPPSAPKHLPELPEADQAAQASDTPVTTSPELAETPEDTPPPRNEPLPEFGARDEATQSEPAELPPIPTGPPPPIDEDLPELDTAKAQPQAPASAALPAGSVAASAAPLAAAAAEAEAPKAPSRKVDFSAAPTRPAPAAGFASRRAPGPEGSESAPSLGGASRATPPLPDSKPAPKTEEAAPAPDPVVNVPPIPRAAPSPAAAPLAPQVPVETPVDPAAASVPPAVPEPQPDSSSLTPKSPATGLTFLSRRKPKEKKPRKGRRLTPAALAAPTPASEAERMTIFGARRRDEVGGKPRFLGLILTAALLVFLAGVAAWASIFLDEGTALSRLFGDRGPRSTAEATAPDQPAQVQPDVENIAVLPPEPSGPDAIETAALDAGLTDEDGAVLDALREPDPRPTTEMTEAEVDAKYATTGIWPRAPQVPPAPAAAIDIEDLYLTSIDPISTTTDAVALPAVDRFATDMAPGDVASPAAAGTTFDMDASGLVTPTAKGAVSPDGHLVYLGRPAAVPPATLAKREVVPEASPIDSALAQTRPRTRPEDLSETNERAQLGGLTRSELAGIRPALRPQSLQEAAEEALAAAAVPEATVAPIDTSDAVAAALATPPAIENATAQATKLSRRPDTRPRNFDRIVKRAERTEAPTQVASVAPRAVQPKIPSKTSVAKQATVKNAINLRKVNLIGVYGKPSNRRALVRLSNGRYQKVEVGDRIDGGRVAAIGDNQLRYVKRGRNVVLEIPD